jgi:SAM-dependent methyltransferase
LISTPALAGKGRNFCVNSMKNFTDYRVNAMGYYDKFATPPPGDVEFYRSQVMADTRVLELGCGTGRVLVPLAGSAGYIHGLDHSPSMLEVCRQKLGQAGVDGKKARVEVADITDFDLTAQMPVFDLITAPYRVMQNLETDEQLAGLMACIGKHLAPGGMAILNTFFPRRNPEELKAFWDSRNGCEPGWSVVDGEDTVTVTDICTHHRDNPMIVYPKIIYHRHDASGRQIDEATLQIPMRVWYPEELLRLIESRGFVVTDRKGGYEGEAWGEGPELVVVFRHSNPQ